MEFQSYNSELGTANILFKRIFSNIRIGRTDSNGEEKQLLVQCVLGLRSRILKNLENPERRGNMKLPMIIISRTGYARNGDRLNNLHNEVKYELASYNRKYHLMAPVPVDISYDVTVVAKYPSDIDKIASNFMVFFNSDIYVSCEHPKYLGIKMNNLVVMSDSVSEDHPDEFDGSLDDITSATFNFTFKTYLFGGTKLAKLVPLKVLSSVTSAFMSSYIVEIKANEIDDFLKLHPNLSVSALLSTNVTADISTYVDNPETSSTVYDDIPIVNKIDFGFYVVPKLHDIDSYILSVDNGAFGEHVHISRYGYISSQSYISGDMTMLSDPYAIEASAIGEPLSTCEFGIAHKQLSTIGDFYDIVDNDCSLEPYVDKLYWKIDGMSLYEYPNNVIWERG